MIRVMVVDDERHVVDHIVRLIEKELGGEFLVCATASSGREALEKASADPDIVVLDVKMPGLSGLDTVREMRRRGVEAAVILATAYERFDIAREALQLGISGYLLKPVVRDDLVKALRAAEDQRARASRGPSTQEQEDELRDLAAATFLQQLTLGRSDALLAREALRRLTGGREWALVAAVALGGDAAVAWPALVQALSYKSEALGGPLVGTRGLLLLPLAGPAATEGRGRQLVTTVLSLAPPGGGLRVALSDPRPLAELGPAWAEALGRLASEAPESRPTQPDLEEAFADALSRGDPTAAEAALADWLDGLGPGPLTDLVRYRVMVVVGAALLKLEARGRLGAADLARALDGGDLLAAPDVLALRQAVWGRVPLLREASSSARPRVPGLVQALDLIRERFAEALTLEGVADAVGLSPKRLSRLLVDDLGQGFSEYLIEVRIARAKQLLSQPGHSIKQVAIDCGYPDPNYFARLFKKVSGLTPTEFASRPT